MRTLSLTHCAIAIALASTLAVGSNQAIVPVPNLQSFKDDLERFARAVELHCGFSPGDALHTHDQHQVTVSLRHPKTVSYAQFQCLIEALQANDVKVGIVSQSLP